ncbi:hypothetical protein SS50377_20432 [Spironucleus salmonicida]|uniref:Uncharacterized protein n=1 Tax=Spironucleus salmonicida TaxID=348837 RepID=V6LLM4_9EUKA|nr:hypothetical protein SS50377_20432 [Spironucleus salmonicida]|eukprot:EST45590.1 Hypothetical protein SS50377_14436 [Spironucleus salmonicida]
MLHILLPLLMQVPITVKRITHVQDKSVRFPARNYDGEPLQTQFYPICIAPDTPLTDPNCLLRVELVPAATTSVVASFRLNSDFALLFCQHFGCADHEHLHNAAHSEFIRLHIAAADEIWVRQAVHFLFANLQHPLRNGCYNYALEQGEVILKSSAITGCMGVLLLLGQLPILDGWKHLGTALVAFLWNFHFQLWVEWSGPISGVLALVVLWNERGKYWKLGASGRYCALWENFKRHRATRTSLHALDRPKALVVIVKKAADSSVENIDIVHGKSIVREYNGSGE